MAVDEVLRHWVMEVSGEEAGPDGFGRAAGQMATFFYAEDSILASTRAERIHKEFNVLKNLLDRMDLRNNVRNTVSMVCKPFQSVGGNLAETYARWMMGVGMMYHVNQRQCMWCP